MLVIDVAYHNIRFINDPFAYHTKTAARTRESSISPLSQKKRSMKSIASRLDRGSTGWWIQASRVSSREVGEHEAKTTGAVYASSANTQRPESPSKVC